MTQVFRLWNYNVKHYVPVDDYTISSQGNVITGHGTVVDHLKLEWFTGMADVHGRAIFEGDIVEIHSAGHQDTNPELTEQRLDFQAVVRYDVEEGCFTVDGYPITRMLNRENSASFEVVDTINNPDNIDAL